MRLLNIETWKLQVFQNERELPPYCILSHTWGAYEVTLQEFELLGKEHPSVSKITRCSEQTLKDGFAYIWVDTCCIDKTSSAELSEAINSMFRWYNQSRICYAYLVDVKGGADTEEFEQSRWFTRGWTLQELLAPERVEFYNTSWDHIGNSVRLSPIIARVAGIRSSYLQDSSRSRHRMSLIREASVAEKMSWACKRETTRIEDIAYCLMGIFEVNMPMLYGEGDRAFVRLQEEIMKDSSDLTIFVWGFDLPLNRSCTDGIFAESPADFAGCDMINPIPSTDLTHHTMTNLGLQITLPLKKMELTEYAVLKTVGVYDRCIALPLEREVTGNTLKRSPGSIPFLIDSSWAFTIPKKSAYISKRRVGYIGKGATIDIKTAALQAAGYKLVEANPPSAVVVITEYGISIERRNQALFRFLNNSDDKSFLLVIEAPEGMGNGAPIKYWVESFGTELSIFECMLKGAEWKRAPSFKPEPFVRLKCKADCDNITEISIFQTPNLRHSHQIEIRLEESRQRATSQQKTCKYHLTLEKKSRTSLKRGDITNET
ncbi:HET-domain-containing protein [Cadophora sp. DSE1049]|nr:HET-domain-containing protein [Cadophora sp. DSE1049]